MVILHHDAVVGGAVRCKSLTSDGIQLERCCHTWTHRPSLFVGSDVEPVWDSATVADTLTLVIDPNKRNLQAREEQLHAAGFVQRGRGKLQRQEEVIEVS